MADVIDSLKRLERIGSENSKTTQKLLTAARELADQIVHLCALSVDESISVERAPSVKGTDEVHNARVKPIAKYKVDRLSLYMNDKQMSSWSRDSALSFSEHIANGLLDLIAAELEQRQHTSKRAMPALETAIELLKTIQKQS